VTGLRQLAASRIRRSRAADDATRALRARTILRRFRKDIRKRKGKLAAGTGFAVIYSLARVAEPWPLKVVFDQVLFHQKPSTAWWFAPFQIFGTSSYDLLAASALLLGLSGVVRGVSYYYEDFLLSSAAQEIVYGIRSRLYRHLHSLSMSFYGRRQAGDTLVRLSTDIVLLRDVLVDFIVNIGTGVILIVMMTAVMIAIDPVLTLAAMLVIPMIVLLTEPSLSCTSGPCEPCTEPSPPATWWCSSAMCGARTDPCAGPRRRFSARRRRWRRGSGSSRYWIQSRTSTTLPTRHSRPRWRAELGSRPSPSPTCPIGPC